MDHIKTVMGHFKGRIHEWDVVNEAMSWDPVESWDGLSQSLWKRIAKSEKETYDYIDQVFWAAHEADPEALLYINDYGIEFNNIRF